MKKVIYIAFLCLSSLGFGQNYDVYILTEDLTTNVPCDMGNVDIILNIITDANNIPISYDLTDEGYGEEEGIGEVCQYLNTTNHVIPTDSDPFCDIYSESLGDSSCCVFLDVTFIIEPVLTILTPNPGMDNAVATITLEATPGFPPEVYRWQYFHPDTNVWTLIPVPFQGQSSITFNAIDLFGVNASNYYGVSIQYKLEMCNGFKPSAFNIPYIYAFTNSSPQVISHTTQNATCTYSNNGAFTLTFDRNLEAGETIQSVNLYTAGEDGIFETADDVNETPIIPNGEILAGGITTVYTYTAGLKPNDYKIKYQLGPDGEAVKYGPITIGSVSSAVNFNVAETDVSCFNANNGSLEITASGGVGNYQYKLNANAWANFSSATSHTINGLGPDIYNVQVRDGNQCDAQ